MRWYKGTQRDKTWHFNERLKSIISLKLLFEKTNILKWNKLLKRWQKRDKTEWVTSPPDPLLTLHFAFISQSRKKCRFPVPCVLVSCAPVLCLLIPGFLFLWHTLNHMYHLHSNLQSKVCIKLVICSPLYKKSA